MVSCGRWGTYSTAAARGERARDVVGTRRAPHRMYQATCPSFPEPAGPCGPGGARAGGGSASGRKYRARRPPRRRAPCPRDAPAAGRALDLARQRRPLSPRAHPRGKRSCASHGARRRRAAGRRCDPDGEWSLRCDVRPANRPDSWSARSPRRDGRSPRPRCAGARRPRRWVPCSRAMDRGECGPGARTCTAWRSCCSPTREDAVGERLRFFG